MKDTIKVTENKMGTKRKTIPNLPEAFEKKMIYYFKELPDSEMFNPIDELFKNFKRLENNITQKIEQDEIK